MTDDRLAAAAPAMFDALVAVRRSIEKLPTSTRIHVDRALRQAGWTFPRDEEGYDVA